MIRGMIFDLDGTLADTLPVCFAAFREVFRKHLGRDYTDQEIRAMFGPTEGGILRQRISGNWEAALNDYLREYERAHVLCPQPFPGLRGALEDLQERGIGLGIVTGKGPQSADISLRSLGLAQFFDPVRAGSSNGGIKPESMRSVLKRWGLQPDQVACLGDSRPDVQSARQIGAVPLAAAWASTADYDALLALEPAAIFRQVEEFLAWINETIHLPEGQPSELAT